MGKRCVRMGVFGGLLLTAGCVTPPELSASSPEAASSPQVAALVTLLQARFRLPQSSPHLSPEHEPSRAVGVAGETRSLLRRSPVERFEERDGWLVPRLPAPARRVHRPARVRLPSKASRAFEVLDEVSGLAMQVQRVGATEATAEVAEGWVAYRGGIPGGDVLHRVHGEGTEDYVYFASKPQREELRYRVGVGAFAGVRLVNNVVELLDRAGYPRLRVRAPLALDARGEKVTLKVGVEGCAVDENPAAPWARGVVSPGSSTCEVVVGWHAEAYPLVVDPAFVTTGSLAVGRSLHTASVLGDGSVLIAGGKGFDSSCPGSYCKTLERWSNGSFSEAGILLGERFNHAVAVLPDDSVLIVGGTGGGTLCSGESWGTCKRAERWKNGISVEAGTMETGRYFLTANTLPDGSVLVVGGRNINAFESAVTCPYKFCKTAELWKDGVFSGAGSLAAGRQSHTASVLPDGSVLVVGGQNENEPFACPQTYCKTAERWKDGIFSDAGAMKVGRSSHTADVLPDGSVLFVGSGIHYSSGIECPGSICQTMERWSNGEFVEAGKLIFDRNSHTASLLPDGSVLVVGGASSCSGDECKTVERWSNGNFTVAGSLPAAMGDHTSSVLPDGSVLVVGGSRYGDDECLNGYCKNAYRWIEKPTCTGEFEAVTETGTVVPCKGKCLAGQCQESCSGPAECAPQHSCQENTCVEEKGAVGAGGSDGAGGSGAGGSGGGGGDSTPAAGSGGSGGAAGGVPGTPTPETGDDGCGCRLPGPPAQSHGAWMGLLLGLAAFRRCAG